MILNHVRTLDWLSVFPAKTLDEVTYESFVTKETCLFTKFLVFV